MSLIRETDDEKLQNEQREHNLRVEQMLKVIILHLELVTDTQIERKDVTGEDL